MLVTIYPYKKNIFYKNKFIINAASLISTIKQTPKSIIFDI